MKRLIVLAPLALLACGPLDTADQAQYATGEEANMEEHGPGSGPVSPGPVSHGSVNTGPLPEGCVKIEDGDVGVEGIVVGTATITGWVTKDGEPGEYIGFSYTGGGWVSVKAGRETFVAEGGAWVHPAGTSGPEASAISNVVVCDEPPTSGGEPDPGNGGEPDPGNGGEEGGCESSADCAAGEMCSETGICIGL